MINDIPEVVILRLPLYARVLASLEGQGVEVVSSQTLGTLLQATPAQIRKDLSYFGRFGKQGRGYRVSGLLRELRQILGLDATTQNKRYEVPTLRCFNPNHWTIIGDTSLRLRNVNANRKRLIFR